VKDIAMRKPVSLEPLTLSDLARDKTYLRFIVSVDGHTRVERFIFGQKASTSEEELRFHLIRDPGRTNERVGEFFPEDAGLIPDSRSNLHRVFIDTPATMSLLKMLAKRGDLRAYMTAIQGSLSNMERHAFPLT
jgi:hypothetical protein